MTQHDFIFYLFFFQLYLMQKKQCAVCVQFIKTSHSDDMTGNRIPFYEIKYNWIEGNSILLYGIPLYRIERNSIYKLKLNCIEWNPFLKNIPMGLSRTVLYRRESRWIAWISARIERNSMK